MRPPGAVPSCSSSSFFCRSGLTPGWMYGVAVGDAVMGLGACWLSSGPIYTPHGVGAAVRGLGVRVGANVL
jgi:hypothetical protein